MKTVVIAAIFYICIASVPITIGFSMIDMMTGLRMSLLLEYPATVLAMILIVFGVMMIVYLPGIIRRELDKDHPKNSPPPDWRYHD